MAAGSWGAGATTPNGEISDGDQGDHKGTPLQTGWHGDCGPTRGAINRARTRIVGMIFIIVGRTFLSAIPYLPDNDHRSMIGHV